MANWMETAEGRRVVRNKDFLLISLGTNDVGRYGVEIALQRCGELIRYIRQSFQGIRAIGWLALSPRWKPTRFISAAEFGELHYQFNERLRLLSKQLDFDVVDACLGPEDMRVEDGLHPSTTTGRWKYEDALREWFTAHAVTRHDSLFQRQQTSTRPDETDDMRPLMPRRHQPPPPPASHYQHQRRPAIVSNGNRQILFNNTQPFSVTTDRTVEQLGNSDSSHGVRPSIPTKALIRFYPHKLRTIEQYYRENEVPKELEKDRNQIFLAANLYYQYRHFQEEGIKWKIYEQVASRKEPPPSASRAEKPTNELEELPLARPFRERYANILDITLSSDSEHRRYISEASQSNSSSDSENDDSKKRKIQDTSLSPTSKENVSKTTDIKKKKKEKSRKKKKIPIEQDPRAPEGSPILAIIGEKRQEAAATATSVSPSAKRPRLYSELFEPQRAERPQRTVTHPVEASPDLPRTPPGLPQPPALSPRQSTPRTPLNLPQPLVHPHAGVAPPAARVASERVEPMDQETASHSPSAVRKDSEIIGLVSFPIIPIECKFHFRTFNTVAKAETISSHQKFLEKKSAQAEKQLEQLLRQFSENKHRTVIEFVKNSIEPLIDFLNSSNQKRLDNLVLDQMREQALRTIRTKCSQLEIGHIEKTQTKFERSLDLKFQLDKLDRRLNENMPPPSLNVLDKLEFRSKELSPESKAQYSEQWNSVLRKTKLELTSIMRLAKTTEIANCEKEHSELVEQIPVEIRRTYRELVHTVQVRQDKVVEKKLHFLDRKAQRITEK